MDTLLKSISNEEFLNELKTQYNERYETLLNDNYRDAVLYWVCVIIVIFYFCYKKRYQLDLVNKVVEYIPVTVSNNKNIYITYIVII